MEKKKYLLTKDDLKKAEKKLDKKIDNVKQKLDGRIGQLDNKIDDVEQRLNKRIDELDKKIDDVEQRLNKRIDELDKKIDDVEQRLDDKINKVGLEVIKHTQMIEEIRKNMVTKEIYEVLDEIVRIVRKLDQERIFTVEWIERIEEKV